MVWFHWVPSHRVLVGRVVAVALGALVLLQAPVVGAQQQGGQNQQGNQNQQGQPVLTVAVSGPLQANFGAAVVYGITLSNVGDTAASGVLLRVTHASVLHMQTTGGLKCVAVPAPRFANPRHDCSGTVAGATSVNLTLAGFAPKYVTSIGMTAAADPRNQFGNSNGSATGKTATIATAVATLLPDLVVDASGVPLVTQAGSTFTSAIDVRNIGPGSASGITLVDTLPAGSSFVSATPAAGFICAGTGDIVTCTGGSLAPGGDALLQIAARAPLNTALATTTIVVDPANALQELNKLNNSATRSVVVLAGLADLTIAYGAVPSVVPLGAPFTVTLFVGNVGTAAANPVKLIDSFTRVSLASYTASSGFTCQTTNFKGLGGAVGTVSGVECKGGSLAPGDIATITLNLVADILPQTWTQQATVNPTGATNESNVNNNSATSTVKFQ
jgi:uncharacterized repeat protein (TIGR01451 family)